MSNSFNHNKGQQSTLRGDLFLPLRALSEKYRYTQDHLAWLARTGRVDAIRLGKKGEWHVSEASLAGYRTAIIQAGGDYAPLAELAQQYGYAKDYLGLLARLGKITAKKSPAGQWFADPFSVQEYYANLKDPKSSDAPVTSSPAPVVPESQIAVPVPSVPQPLPAVTPESSASQAEPVLSNHEGSSIPRKLFTPINVAAAFLIAGGIFVFMYWPQINTTVSSLFDPYHSNPTPTEIALEPIQDLPTPTARPISDSPVPTPAETIARSPVSQPAQNSEEAGIIHTTEIKEITVNQNLSSQQLDELTQRLLNTTSLQILPMQQALTSLTSTVQLLQQTTGRVAQAPLPADLSSVQYPSAVAFSAGTFSGPLTAQDSLTVSDNFSVGTTGFFVDSERNQVGIGTRNLETAFEVVGTASISGDLTLGGSINVGTINTLGSSTVSGDSTVGGELAVTGSGSFGGQIRTTWSPTAHTGSWPTFNGVSYASLYINPSTSVSDGALISAGFGDASKFVVDAEGDVFANNLTLTGTTVQATTDITGNLTVEGNTTLGDAASDTIRLTGIIQPYSLTSNIFNLQASPSWAGDYYAKMTDSSSNGIFVVASTGNVGIGTTSPSQKLDVSGIARANTFYANGSNGSDGYGFVFNSAATTGSYLYSGSVIHMIGGTQSLVLYSDRVRVDASKGISLGADIGTYLDSDTAGVVEINNGTSGQYRDLQLRAINPTSGNVGIGTTNPQQTLEVKGFGRFSNSATTAGYSGVEFASDGALQWQLLNNVTTNAFGLWENGTTQRLTVLEGGNVGIGDTTPDYLLDVAGTLGVDGASLLTGAVTIPNTLLVYTTGGNQVTIDAYATSQTSDLIFKQGGNFAARIQGLASNAGLAFNVGTDAADMTILSNGNVGIGTTSPGEILHVYKNDVAANVTAKIENAATGNNANLQLKSSEDWYLQSLGSGSGLTGAFGIYDNTQSAYRILINTSGNIGIGTTSPGAKIHVVGTAGDNPIANFASASGTSALYIDKRSRVGIGTDSPTSIAHIRSTSVFPTLNIESTQTGGGILQLTSSTNNWQMYNGSGKLQWDGSTTAEVEMTIDSAGDVGIGTTDPVFKLDVNGNAGFRNGLVTIDDYGIAGYSKIGGTDNIVFTGGSGRSVTFQTLVDMSSYGVNVNQLVWAGIGQFTAASPFVDLSAPLKLSGATSGTSLAVTGGNVGIGTTTPTTKFQVVGAASISTNFEVGGTASVGGNAYFAGNVGIGTTSPTAKLELFAANTQGVLAGYNTSNSNRQVFGITTSSNNGIFTLNNSTPTTQIQLHTAGVSYFNGGNVGIGTTNPVALLELAKTAPTTVTRASEHIHFNSSSHAVGGLSLIGVGYPGTYSWGYMGFVETDTSTYGLGDIIFGTRSVSTDTEPSERMRITSSGLVGIGTTNPGTLLDVNGEAQIRGRLSGGITLGSSGSSYSDVGYNIRHTASNNTWNYLAADTASLIQFTDGGLTVKGTATVGVAGNPVTFSMWLEILKTGNTGIGATPTTAARLSVGASQVGKTTVGDSRVLLLQNTSGGLNELQEMGMGYKAANTYQPVVIGHKVTEVGDYTKGDFYIATRDATTDTAPTERFYITSGGLVGIGTTTATATFGLTVASASAGIAIKSTDSTSSASLSFLPANANSQNKFTIRAGGLTSTLGERLEFLNGGNTSLMTIASSGNVGIGTTVPANRLTVKGNVAASNFVDLGLANITGTSMMTFTVAADASTSTIAAYNHLVLSAGSLGGTGNVGIGTTSPLTKFQVGSGVDTTANLVRITTGGGADASPTLSLFRNGSSEGLISYISGSKLIFGNDPAGYTAAALTSAAKMTLEVDAGNLGLGTTSPTTKFQVVGAASISANFEVGGTASVGGNAYFSGNVGIGTTNPAFKLQVLTAGGYNGDTTSGFAVSDSTTPAKKIYMGYDVTLSRGFIQAVQSGSAYQDFLINPNGGNVGIGTTNPRQRLHVSDGGGNTSLGATQILVGSAANVGQFAGIGFGWQGSTNAASSIGLIATDASGNVYGDLIFNTRAVTTDSAPTEKMRISSSGSVGIGDSSPTEGTLVIAGQSPVNTPLLYIGGNAAATSGTAYAARIASKIYSTSGTGTIADAYGLKLDLTTDDSSLAFTTSNLYHISITDVDTPGSDSVTSQYGLFIDTLNDATNNWSIYTGTAQSLFQGNVSIGSDPTPDFALDVTGDINSDDCFREAGAQIAGTCASDFNLKKNIIPLENSLAKLTKLEPVEFEWKEGIDQNPGVRYIPGRQVGLIAQDVQAIFPNLVEEKNGFLAIRYNLELQMLAIASIKELNGDLASQSQQFSSVYYGTGLTVGDVASFNSNTQAAVQKSDSAHDPLGVVTATDATTFQVTVTQAGESKVRVSDEKGSIKAGDRLTVSPTQPGIAIKATKPGAIIGIALEDFNPETSPAGMISASINASFWAPRASMLPASASLDAMMTLTANDGTEFSLSSLFAFILDQMQSVVLKVTGLMTNKVTTQELCVNDTCITEDQLKTLLEQGSIAPAPVAPSATPTPEAIPEVSPTPEGSPAESPTPTPEATPEITPKPTPEATPEATPEQTPEPPTPTPEP